MPGTRLRPARILPCAVSSMRDLLLVLIHLAVTVVRVCRPGGVRAVISENLLLKQQLIVLGRSRRRAPNLRVGDRLLFGLLALLLRKARIRKVAVCVRPSTLLAFHQALVRRKYGRLFSSIGTTKTPGPKGSGPSWLSFIGHATDSLWSVDLFRCESTVLQSYWVLVVMDQFTRRLVGFGVHHGPVDVPNLCRMFNTAIHGQGAPRRLSTDHDPLFEAHRWKANLRLLEVDEIKTVPHVPLSHPFVERLIGTIRREFLDHVLFWNTRDLERKLADFQDSYNAARGHASLEGRTPSEAGGARTAVRGDLNKVRWMSHCRGLVQLPTAA